MKIKEDSYYLHVKARMKERFNIEIDEVDHLEICYMTKNAKGRFMSKGRFICLIEEWRNLKYLPTVWDKNLNVVVTVLSHAMYLSKLEMYGLATRSLSGNFYGRSEYTPFLDAINKGIIKI